MKRSVAAKESAKMTPEPLLQEMTRRLVDQFHPQAVILFGSQARGTADPRSDVDLLVLVDQAFDISAGTNKMYAAMTGLAVPVDIVVMRQSEFEELKDYVGTIARPAAREGRVLYKRVA